MTDACVPSRRRAPIRWSIPRACRDRRQPGRRLSLAVAGLVPDLMLALPEAPFMCHWRRATEITDSDPYHEIVRFARVRRDQVERVFTTLSYFDGVNFAVRARAPALFSVA